MIKNILVYLNQVKFLIKSRCFLASSLSTYAISTLYATLPYNLIKEKLTELMEQTFIREVSFYLTCSNKNAFFTSEQPKRYKVWSCQKMCDALHYILDNIFIRFDSKLYRQFLGIQMGTNCAPLIADLFSFRYFCLVLLCFHARLFVDALWSPAGKGLTSRLSFVMSNCDVVTFPLVSWVRCGA